MKKHLLPLSALILAVGASGAVWAQSGASQAQGGHASTPPAAAAHRNLPKSSDISDDQVQKFAKAEQKVQAIKASYRQKYQAQSKDPKKAMNVQRQAQRKMVKAVKDSGLQVRQYNQIAQASQYDTKLRKRIKDAE